jgi:membrane-associated phospholipid phosphatase
MGTPLLIRIGKHRGTGGKAFGEAACSRRVLSYKASASGADTQVSIKKLIAWWCIVLLAVLVAIIASVQWLDMPIARYFLGGSGHVAGLAGLLGSPELVAGEASLMAILAIIRIMRGTLPDYAKALFVACVASLSAFTINDFTLKVVFGRYNPHVFFQAAPLSVFNFLHGDHTSAFPSGHMVMATAFAAVLIRTYFRTLPLFAGLLCLGAYLLLLGDWHFLSDVIAGTFVGGTIGLVAGELWCEHVLSSSRAI